MLIFWLHNPLNQRFLSPFDALKGFNEAIASKDIIYEDRRVLSDEDIRHLNHAIGILYNLTKTRQLATLTLLHAKNIIIDGIEVRLSDILSIESQVFDPMVFI